MGLCDACKMNEHWKHTPKQQVRIRKDGGKSRMMDCECSSCISRLKPSAPLAGAVSRVPRLYPVVSKEEEIRRLKRRLMGRRPLTQEQKDKRRVAMERSKTWKERIDYA